MAPSKSDNLATWLDYLAGIHVSAIDMGLERVLPVFKELNIHPPTHVITVAGTNGKGSVSATIASICQQAGYGVALYQSPHLFCFNERIRIDGKMVCDERLIEAFWQIEQARAFCQLSLSFFEMTTLAAFWLFARAGRDVWVLEVGLGGLLDVVNVIDPTLAVITNVAIDHTDWLGDNRESIGRQKAGIVRDGIPVIYGERDVPNSVRDTVFEHNACLSVFGQEFDYVCRHDNFIFSSKASTLCLPLPRLSVHNTAIAVAAVLECGLMIDRFALKAGIAATWLAGRFDTRQFAGRRWLFDVAHNVAGVQFLLEQWWVTHPQKQPWHVVFSMLADKPVDEVLAYFVQQLTAKGVVMATVHIARLDNPRAIGLDDLHKKWLNYTDATIYTHQSIAQATISVQSLADDYPVLCFGSFHTVAEAVLALDRSDSCVAL